MNRRAFLSTLGAAAAAPVVPAIAARTVPTYFITDASQFHFITFDHALSTAQGIVRAKTYGMYDPNRYRPTLPIHTYKQKWPNL